MPAPAAILKKVVIKHKGNLSAAARELKVTPQAISARLTDNPEIKESIQEHCRRELERAGASVKKIFQVTAAGLDSYSVSLSGKQHPNFKERRESSKLCHQLLGNLSVTNDGPLSSGPIIVMPMIQVNGESLVFKSGKNAIPVKP